MWRAIRDTVCGVPAMLVFVYPMAVGLFAYGIMFLFSVVARFEIAIWIGYISLLLLPCYMLGNAFWTDPTELPDDPVPQNLRPSQLIEIWTTCQDLEMHFDNIELQIRNYAVTLLVAVTGAAAFALREHLDIEFRSHKFSMAIPILSAGVLGWLAFYFVDKHWYHRLLLGAVRHTLKVEKAFGPALDLSGSIARDSPIPMWGKHKIYSTQKFGIFYAAGLTFFIIFIGMVLAEPTIPSANRQVGDYARRLPIQLASKPDFYARKDTLQINGTWIRGNFIPNGGNAACTSENTLIFPLASIDHFDDLAPCPAGSSLVRVVLKP